MRLLRYDSAEVISFTDILPKDRIPPYAILSHRWGPDSDEVKYQDIRNGTAASKPGYDKISFCIRQAQRDGLSHFWIDTCCIDKSNSTELSKAINSMFRWYKNAEKCYVYLSDVPRSLPERSGLDFPYDWEQDFRASTWFTRGWTLQELLAPKSVDFFSRRGERLGNKSYLETHISDITGIPVKALRNNVLHTFTIQERFSWQDSRVTTEEEDKYYSLLGIMGVSISIIYGEGERNARSRLEREIAIASKGCQFEDFSITFSLAGVVEVRNFVARRNELDEMRETLFGNGSRRSVVLYGLGGIGKTQLAVAYATRYKDNYSAVFWLNIKDIDSIQSSFIKVAQQILRDHPFTSRLSRLDLKGDVDTIVEAVKAWLSLPNNTRWLLIFDNYDNPKLPDSTDSTAVDIRTYLPDAYQGSVIVTARSSEVDIGHCMQVTKLSSLEDSLSILSSSSQRQDFPQDPDAKRLARKLDGLPLALATAGAYLRRTPTVSCARYLRFYEDSWAKLQKTSPKLTSYEDRTLYSTWQISLDQIQNQDSLAASLLRLWAYFDSQDLWFELLRHTTKEDPEWLKKLVSHELDFHNYMRVLCNHGVVEKDVTFDNGLESPGYSIHTCVHSWTKTVLNASWDPKLAKAALYRVASHVPLVSTPKWWVTSRRLLNHAANCTRAIENGLAQDGDIEWACSNLGNLYLTQEKLEQAEQMYERALRGSEKALGPDHTSTLDTVHSLGLLYYKQGKLEEAEQIYERALRGREKALGPDHTSTLDTVHSLGLLYCEQGKLEEAEQMCERALRGQEKALGPDHTSTLGTVQNLGLLYCEQGKLEEAEQMCERALRGQEKALGPDHTSTLDTVHNLGILYYTQGKLEEAEQIYERALRGSEKALGPDHTSTLDTVHNLGNLYYKQGKLEEAQQMYERALRGYRDVPHPPQARIESLERFLSSFRSDKHNSGSGLPSQSAL